MPGAVSEPGNDGRGTDPDSQEQDVQDDFDAGESPVSGRWDAEEYRRGVEEHAREGLHLKDPRRFEPGE
jgi:hypothetical protein